MTAQELKAIATARIPTPEEFVTFVETQGWSISVKDDGTASLKASASDPLAKPLARMLSREPWRTNVLKLVTGRRGHKEQVAAVRVVALDAGLSVGDAPAEKPTGRPADFHNIDPTGEMVRAGVCRARTRSHLCWAKYAAGGWYWYEEWLIENGGKPAVRSFRVFGGGSVGFATPSKFIELFDGSEVQSEGAA